MKADTLTFEEMRAIDKQLAHMPNEFWAEIGPRVSYCEEFTVREYLIIRDMIPRFSGNHK